MAITKYVYNDYNQGWPTARRKELEFMELRFIIEHAKATIATVDKLRLSGDRVRSIAMLEELGNYINERFREGVLVEPNIDVKPAEPG